MIGAIVDRLLNDTLSLDRNGKTRQVVSIDLACQVDLAFEASRDGLETQTQRDGIACSAFDAP